MTRYLFSFFITLVLYTSAFALVFLSFSSFETKKINKKEKKISLNFVQLEKEKQVAPIVQEKKVIKKEKLEKKIEKKIPKKVKPKKVLEKKVVKQKEEIKELIKENKVEELKIDTEEKKELSKPKYSYEEEFLKEHLLAIQRIIQKHVKYSNKAKRLNIEGEVLVKFKLTKNGIEGDILTLSGHRLLRKSTIKAIIEASAYFPEVKKNIIIKIPITYKLI